MKNMVFFNPKLGGRRIRKRLMKKWKAWDEKHHSFTYTIKRVKLGEEEEMMDECINLFIDQLLDLKGV